MSYRYRLAIFDLDGTVLDTLDDLADSVNAVLAANGYPTHTKQTVCSFVGNGIKKLIERAVPNGIAVAEVARVLSAFEAYYALHCADKTAPYEGISEMLASLRAAGVKTAVLSNKADFATQALCHEYFPGVFDVVAGEREKEGIPKKPAPDALFAIMKQCGATAADTVYIGDSDVDILTAANAGVDAILVSWGFRDEAFLRERGAKTVVHTAKELKAMICAKN
ncbi:MAG: HAD family hydrolase [Ruminococcaceae bacterium]|nr:HAD family hydrolase [Oscillospiraceae bacterium]